MKRLFLTISLCFSVLILCAQPFGRGMRNRFPGQPQSGGFRELLSYGETPINARSIINMLVLNPELKMTSEEAERYGHEQLLNDMYEFFLPVYRTTLTHADISFILAIYHSPDVSQAIRHLSIFDELPGEEQAKYIVPGINAIVAGETPQPVKLNDGIPQRYLEAAKAYYDVTGRNERLAQLKQYTTQNSNDEGAKRLGQIADYLMENNTTLTANVAFGKVTEEEFRLIAGLYETRAFQHFKAGHANLSSQSQDIFGKIIERAKAWKAKKEQSAE